MFKKFLLTPLICCSLIGLACDFEKRRKVGLGYLVVLSYPGICTGASRSKTQGQCCIHVWSNISTRWRVGFYIVRFPNPLAFGLGLTWRGKKEFKYNQSGDWNLLQDGNMIENAQSHCLFPFPFFCNFSALAPRSRPCPGGGWYFPAGKSKWPEMRRGRKEGVPAPGSTSVCSPTLKCQQKNCCHF